MTVLDRLPAPGEEVTRRLAQRRSATLPTLAGGPVRRQPEIAGMSPAGLFALQQTAGNAAVARQAAGTATMDAGVPAAAPPASTVPVGRRTGRPIADLEREFRGLITAARASGKNVAADNLEHFLDGRGATKAVPLSWLRGFSAVTDAEDKNHKRFQDQLETRAKALADGATTRLSDHWDARISGSPLTELYYASGISQLKSTGSFDLSRSGSTILINGPVAQRWFDPYDWNPGMGAWIPGHGTVSDDVGLDLKDAGVGRNYLLEVFYSQTLNGNYRIEPWYLPDIRNFVWLGP